MITSVEEDYSITAYKILWIRTAYHYWNKSLVSSLKLFAILQYSHDPITDYIKNNNAAVYLSVTTVKSLLFLLFILEATIPRLISTSSSMFNFSTIFRKASD